MDDQIEATHSTTSTATTAPPPAASLFCAPHQHSGDGGERVCELPLPEQEHPGWHTQDAEAKGDGAEDRGGCHRLSPPPAPRRPRYRARQRHQISRRSLLCDFDLAAEES